MFNPYSGKAARTNPRSGSIRTAQSERFFNDEGEINAYNKKDLIDAHRVILASLKKGDLDLRDRADVESDNRESAAILKQAFTDKTGESWTVLGQTIGNDIYETMGREGLSRRLMLLKHLERGEVGRFRIRKKDVQGWMTTTAAMIAPSEIRGHYVYPEEFYLEFNIHIEEREIAQTDTDILDEKYHDGLEQIMKAEDVVAKTLWDATVGIANPLTFFNTFTPTVFTNLKTSIRRWGVHPVAAAVIAWDIWDDILASAEFAAWFDPVSKRELMLEGEVGSIMGVMLYTDAFRYDTLRVIEDGEVYFFGPPVTVGGILERSSLVVRATDQYNQGRAVRGWFGHQIESMTCPNARAISKGQRV